MCLDIKECEHVIDIHVKILNSTIKDLNQTKLSDIFLIHHPTVYDAIPSAALHKWTKLGKILEKLGQDKLALQQGRADRGVKIL